MDIAEKQKNRGVVFKRERSRLDKKDNITLWLALESIFMFLGIFTMFIYGLGIILMVISGFFMYKTGMKETENYRKAYRKSIIKYPIQKGEVDE